MAEPKRPLKVFLCHAHADRGFVHALYTRLIQDGMDAWLDKEKLVGGADWEYEIRNAVRESDVVVVCHSKQFNQKGFRQKEVKIALEEAELLPKGEIFIIPARLEECDVLDDLKRWHWVDLFEFDGYEKLLRALRVRADKIGATLQVKRSWLPRITTPRTKNKKPVEIKKVDDTNEKTVQLIDEIPESELPPKNDAPLSQGNFPDGWGTEWMPSSDSEKAKIEGDEKAEREETAKQLKTQNSSKRSFNTTSFISVMVIVFCVASVTLIPILSSLSKKPEPTPQIKLINTVEVISSPSSALSVNEIPSLTLTPEITAMPTPLPTEITDAKGVPMVLVPAGEFIMGSDNSGFSQDYAPAHKVYLDSFYIDKFEVTNALYNACVKVNICQPVVSSYTSEYPVVGVDLKMSKTYCEVWRGGYLPSEAEWEKSARGTNEKIFPWGDSVDCNHANYSTGRTTDYVWDGKTWHWVFTPTYCIGHATVVGSYENGKSVYGVYDMSGNASEWTSSLYVPYNLSSTVDEIDTNGPVVVRGGSWSSIRDKVTTYTRFSVEPVFSSDRIGFRCAANP